MMVKAGGADRRGRRRGGRSCSSPATSIVDGGNARYQDTRRREAALRERGIHFVGTGISGGEVGALEGPSIMPGGSDESYAAPRPDARDDRRPGRRHAVLHPRRARRRRALREDGAQRHRVRRHAAHRRELRRAAQRRRSRAPPSWRRCSGAGTRASSSRTSSRSRRRCSTTSTRPRATRSSTWWSTRPSRRARAGGRCRSALDLGVPVTGIAEAVFARSLSGRARAAGRGGRPAGAAGRTGRRLGPGPRPPRRRRRAGAVRLEGRRLRAGVRPDRGGQRRVRLGRSTAAPWPRSGAAAASSAPGSSTACARRTTADPSLPTLLVDPSFGEALADAQDAWRRVVATAAAAGRADAGLRLGAGLLRRPAPRPPAGRARAGAARPVRRPHLPAGRPAGHVPHPLVATTGPKRSAERRRRTGGHMSRRVRM